MSSNVSETLSRWNLAAMKERKQTYEYVGLRPFKKMPTYFLALSPAAVWDELATTVTTAFSSHIANLGNTPNHGFTVIPPKNRKNNAAAKAVANPKDTQPSFFENILKENPNIDEFTIILTYVKTDSTRHLQVRIYKPEFKVIDLTLSDKTLENEITNAIAKSQKHLTSKQYETIAQELQKHGYHIKSSGILAKLEKAGEKTKFWSHPVFQRDEVNILNSYVSWKDFFNDVKTLVVKPITVFLLGIGHIVWAIWKLCCGFNAMARRNPDAVAQFDEMLQSLVKALIYSVLSNHLLVLIAQSLSIMIRLLLTIPGILGNTPAAINACVDRGFGEVAGGEFQRFSNGFLSMFQRPINDEPVDHRNMNAIVAEAAGTYDPEAVRSARLSRLGSSN